MWATKGHVHHLLTSDLKDRRRLESGTRHLLKRGPANWRVRLPRHEEHSLCHRSAYTVDLFSLTQQSLPKERVAGAGGEQALVDDPGVGLDLRAPQVFLQSAGLGYRGGFCQGNQ